MNRWGLSRFGISLSALLLAATFLISAFMGACNGNEPNPTSTPASQLLLSPTSVLQEPAATLSPSSAALTEVSPAVTAMAQPAYTPTSAPIPTPSATPVPTPTSIPISIVPPARGVLDEAVINRDMEYVYTLDLPQEDWSYERPGIYSGPFPFSKVTVSSIYLPSNYTMEEFARLILYDLPTELFGKSSLFEIISTEHGTLDDQPTIRLQYRIQEEPTLCVMQVDEFLLVSDLLPGNPHGFRLRLWMCEWRTEGYADAIDDIIDSFRVTTGPAGYYRQFMSAHGVAVKANETVDPAAVEAGATIVAYMLSGRDDIVRCMARSGTELAIIPRDQPLTSIPEYHYLKGSQDFTGRSRDTYAIRGVGAVKGQIVSSAGEEQLLGRLGPQHPFYPFRGLVAVHEFAHAIQNLCFTPNDHELWNGFYKNAQEAGVYPGTHMMANVMEFFAVLTTGYFEVTDELGRYNTRQNLESRFPEIYRALDEIYGGAILPQEFRTRQG